MAETFSNDDQNSDEAGGKSLSGQHWSLWIPATIGG
jgi:hypothetical protein